MNVIRVIALDPGGTTGWAKGLIAEGKMGVISGQSQWNHMELYDSLDTVGPDIIVCERFDYRKSKEGVELISRELIGVVNLYVQQNDVDLYMQMPQEALGGYYMKDSTLRTNKVFMAGKPHANDAMRHLLQWWQFKEGYRHNKYGFYRLDNPQPIKDNLVDLRPL